MAGIEATPQGLRLGALVRMSEAAEHPAVVRDYPVIAETLAQAASAQLRNMARLGGNVLQRTRCNYFRDPSYAQCNKREPGSGCAALDGFNRLHAVLGTSEACIAHYPGDFAQALIALDAVVEVLGPERARAASTFADLHRLPGTTPHIETSLAPGELITAFVVPAGPWTRRSVYTQGPRPRLLRLRAGQRRGRARAGRRRRSRSARIALGGVATVPWRAREAEALLAGQPLDEASATAAAKAAFAGAQVHEHNAYKVPLGAGDASRVRAQRARAAPGDEGLTMADYTARRCPCRARTWAGPIRASRRAPRSPAACSMPPTRRSPTRPTPSSSPARSRKGTIRGFDLAAAKALPGVIDIFTHENLPKRVDVKFTGEGGYVSNSHDPLGSADSRPRRPDRRRRRRRDVRDRARCRPPGRRRLCGRDAVGDPDQPRHRRPTTPPRSPRGGRTRSPATSTAAGRRPAVTVEADYSTPAQHHNPIELFSTTAVWHGDELTIYEPSQFVWNLKNGVRQEPRHRRSTR